MAQKTITQLQLRDNVSSELSLPSDDGIQSYRITAEQMKTFILANENILRAMITPAERTPIGAVLAFAGTSSPTGYLLCDGSAISRTTYGALFAVIGTAHGTGDGSTTFNLPDYRGRFIRGVAGGSTLDQDRASRTAMATGGNTGDNVGSIQGHAFQQHLHAKGTLSISSSTSSNHTHRGTTNNPLLGVKLSGTGVGGNGGSWVSSTDSLISSGGHAHPNADFSGSTATANSSGTHVQTSTTETRPVNAYANFIIKF
jgi:microcystin-dependent protein